MKIGNKKTKSSVLRIGGSITAVVVVTGILFAVVNPARITTPEEVEHDAFQSLGARPGKIELTIWLIAHGFEIDETNYQKTAM